eukprot:SAG11_NODE_18307_length_494_cov_5.182278_2_plen_38_part_01
MKQWGACYLLEGGLGVLLLTVVVRRVVYYTSGKTAGYK